MQDEELTRRGRGIAVGAALLTVGGLIALFGLMYGPFDRTDKQGQVIVASGAVEFALVGAAISIVFGLAATYFFRGSLPMVLCSLLVAVAGVINLNEVLPHL